MAQQSYFLSAPRVVVNNQAIQIVPNSFEYTEGFGEQTVRAQSAGGSAVSLVYSKNVETTISTVKFKLFSTQDNIALVRSWKANELQNSLSATQDTFSRTWNYAALCSDYNVQLKSEGEIEIEFKGTQSV